MNKIILTAAAAGVAVAFAAGYQVANWQNDSHALTAERAAQQAIDAAMQRESEIAAHVEQRLGELQANERVIDRGIIREIQKPIYQRVCLEPSVISLLNHAAAGTDPSATEPNEALP
ncbi:hypothetical protein [Vreelandella neptunia]|uniref:Uncharacterized protein n=1 Tax=Vreelandella neptunia TaxID=115551 RepID=A0ABZ0YKK3_9GAMM|nr:hypothetical protein [Halomonas neptunia]MDN3562108.1 hypothetical protein [Halomonas neptunia]WQH11810.1 hypothetical protein SR894_16855 [Halomonas neptunia]